MTARFDLPESLEEFDEQDDMMELPCFPYPALMKSGPEVLISGLH